MNVNLSVTRKTYYALGLVGCACSMAAALGSLFGTPIRPLESLGYYLLCLMFLMLAAIKGSPAAHKRRYFLCFLLEMVAGIRLGIPLLNYVLLALPMPVFALYEISRGSKVMTQLRFLVLSEALTMLVCSLAATVFPDGGWAYYAMLSITCVARGWLCMALYRLEADRQAKEGI